MNLEQVKEHFKNAKEVRCLDDEIIYNIDEKPQKIYRSDDGLGYFLVLKSTQHTGTEVTLYWNGQLAEITSLKDMDEDEADTRREIGDVVGTHSGDIECVVIDNDIQSDNGNILIRYFYDGNIKEAIVWDFEVY